MITSKPTEIRLIPRLLKLPKLPSLQIPFSCAWQSSERVKGNSQITQSCKKLRIKTEDKKTTFYFKPLHFKCIFSGLGSVQNTKSKFDPTVFNLFSNYPMAL